MIRKLSLNKEFIINSNLSFSDFKKRIESLNIGTNILKTSVKKRQLGLLIKQLSFKTENEFEILKKGDALNPFMSGRGILKGKFLATENSGSTIKIQLRPNYGEFAFNIFILLLILMNLLFTNYETKYLIILGMTGFLIFGLIFQIWFMNLNLKRLKSEFLEIIELIE